MIYLKAKIILFLFLQLTVVWVVQAKIRDRRQSNDPAWHLDHGVQLIGQGLTEMMTGEKPPADLYSTQYEPYNAPSGLWSAMTKVNFLQNLKVDPYQLLLQTMSPTQRYFNNFQNPFDFLFNTR